ncbi:DUF1203 domain-containing protein [Flavitalea flava]
MNNFRIVSLSKEYVQKIRQAGQDDFGHLIVEETASGSGPCRISLKQIKPGIEKRLVISHSPFEIDNVYNQPGPIFLSATDVEEYADVHQFPPEIKYVTLIGYNKDQWMIYTRLVNEGEDINEVISNIFRENQAVSYLHARSTRACCFLCKIERA